MVHSPVYPVEQIGFKSSSSPLSDHPGFLRVEDAACANLRGVVTIGDETLVGCRLPLVDAGSRGLEALTPREYEVLFLAAQGKTNQEIGDIAGMAVGTVRQRLHSTNIKLEVSDRGMANL